MNKKFFATAALAALTVAGLTSCSNDELVEQLTPTAQTGAIGWNITQDGALRTRGTATTSINYTEQIGSVMVLGYFNDGSGRYVGTSDTEGTVIKYSNGEWDYADQDKVQYWPATDKLDFQAITPASDASIQLANEPVSNSPRLTANVTVPTNVTDQKDIMFASATAVNNYSTKEPVDLTFKHALSQIVFWGKVAKSTLKATVSSIELVNIHNTGNVGYLNAVSTLGAQATGDAATTFGVGLTSASVSVESTTATNLTADNGALMMIPQEVTAWTTTAETNVPTSTADTNHNSYLKITCSVMDAGSETKFIDNGTVYIPFAVGWEQGKKYTYTLVFGEGSGGFDENGEPLDYLVPITYTVTSVDDWTEATGLDEIKF